MKSKNSSRICLTGKLKIMLWQENFHSNYVLALVLEFIDEFSTLIYINTFSGIILCCYVVIYFTS